MLMRFIALPVSCRSAAVWMHHCPARSGSCAPLVIVSAVALAVTGRRFAATRSDPMVHPAVVSPSSKLCTA